MSILYHADIMIKKGGLEVVSPLHHKQPILAAIPVWRQSAQKMPKISSGVGAPETNYPWLSTQGIIWLQVIGNWLEIRSINRRGAEWIWKTESG